MRSWRRGARSPSKEEERAASLPPSPEDPVVPTFEILAGCRVPRHECFDVQARFLPERRHELIESADRQKIVRHTPLTPDFFGSRAINQGLEADARADAVLHDVVWVAHAPVAMKRDDEIIEPRQRRVRGYGLVLGPCPREAVPGVLPALIVHEAAEAGLQI